MSKKLISDLRHMASLRAGEITPRHTRLLAEAANQIEMLTEIIHERERDNDKWRKRTIEAENRLRLRGMARNG